MYKDGTPPDKIVKEKGLEQVSDEGEIGVVIDKVLSENRTQVEQYLGGKEKVTGFLVGQVMKVTSGKANPGMVNKILKDKLDAMKTN